MNSFALTASLWWDSLLGTDSGHWWPLPTFVRLGSGPSFRPKTGWWSDNAPPPWIVLKRPWNVSFSNFSKTGHGFSAHSPLLTGPTEQENYPLMSPLLATHLPAFSQCCQTSWLHPRQADSTMPRQTLNSLGHFKWSTTPLTRVHSSIDVVLTGNDAQEQHSWEERINPIYYIYWL